MNFGKLPSVEGVDFTFPPEPVSNPAVFYNAPAPDCQVFLGCPSWACKGWIGKIYPQGSKDKDFLTHYAQHFQSIELNTTYYRTPDLATLTRWKEAVGDRPFVFCPKLNAQISHYRRLKNTKTLVEEFCDAFLPVAERLGTFFLQLPPDFTTNERDKLFQFIEDFPKAYRLGVELRHATWSAEGLVAEVAASLSSHQFPLLITDVAGRRDVLHLHVTAPEIMVRFVGNSLHPSDYTRLDAWARQIGQWAVRGLQRVYFFIHQPEELECPEAAVYFAKQLTRYQGVKVSAPQLLPKNIQTSLF
jgi:uncharacterized protein YecE (DUF72 family)